MLVGAEGERRTPDRVPVRRVLRRRGRGHRARAGRSAVRRAGDRSSRDDPAAERRPRRGRGGRVARRAGGRPESRRRRRRALDEATRRVGRAPGGGRHPRGEPVMGLGAAGGRRLAIARARSDAGGRAPPRRGGRGGLVTGLPGRRRPSDERGAVRKRPGRGVEAWGRTPPGGRRGPRAAGDRVRGRRPPRHARLRRRPLDRGRGGARAPPRRAAGSPDRDRDLQAEDGRRDLGRHHPPAPAPAGDLRLRRHHAVAGPGAAAVHPRLPDRERQRARPPRGRGVRRRPPPARARGRRRGTVRGRRGARPTHRGRRPPRDLRARTGGHPRVGPDLPGELARARVAMAPRGRDAGARRAQCVVPGGCPAYSPAQDAPLGASIAHRSGGEP